ncbi:unnamed protein product [Spirodela intermedia]|uniref:Fe2OG dioxygenase domain-containing protein n=1 Tax=Spirodela intermedia TaxID=51605 RepID=A0A7I8IAK2_SPIIN|nr:unnamed protein product [Spirodela intermedia]CAA6654767.1 unnamed protein product [Spirodela intermedia]
MEIPSYWPEPVIPVQFLAESGITSIPETYVKPPSERPSSDSVDYERDTGIPLVDLGGLERSPTERDATIRQIADACKDWGFFQVSNHGVDPYLVKRMRDAAKQAYANTPETYEGYGSRLGVEKGAILDWGDYFFLIFKPDSLKNREKWPALPHTCKNDRTVRTGTDEAVRTLNGGTFDEPGLETRRLQEAFGGMDGVSVNLRVNFYPRCPHPDLTLGLSAHSDPGILTILLPDERVKGLQIYKDGAWVTVHPVPDTFIINIADQIQILTNGLYKSSVHRVVVNPAEERISFAFFYNPRIDLILSPLPELVTAEQPPLYEAMAYDEYRKYIRIKGPRGKSQLESMKAL